MDWLYQWSGIADRLGASRNVGEPAARTVGSDLPLQAKARLAGLPPSLPFGARTPEGVLGMC
jgi:hypothetical protein